MKTLDRNRPFGTVYGEGVQRFWQDGVGFDAQDDEIDAKAAAAAPVQPATPSGDGRLTADELEAMHISKIRGFVAELNGPAQAGSGSKARLIAWLVENQ